MSWLAMPEFKVGLMVLIVSGIIAGMSLRVTNDPSYLGSAKDVWFYIEDASGLVKNSNVATAGITVGIIKDIRLENGQARVDMVIQGNVPITKSARIEIRPNGILGDKHVEIVAGDPRDPPLRSGEQILVVDDRASVDRLISEVSKITKSLSAVAENIKSATDGDTDKPLGRIVSNIETLSRDLAEITSSNKGRLSDILQSLQDTSDTINDLVNDDGPEGLKQSLRGALRSLRKIESTLDNVEQITAKVNRGEGTIGKLINDETTIDEINSAVTGINSLVDTASRTQTSVDFRTNYVMNGVGARSFLTLGIQPGLDRFYQLGIVSDSRGPTQRIVTTTSGNGAPTSTVQEDRRYESSVLVNALFGKNFYDFSIKGGLIENSGGVGVDYYLFRRRLRFSLEAFNFTNLNLRASAFFHLIDGVYLTAGGEDLGSKNMGSGAFAGAGIFLTNDDLKLLLARIPGT